MKHESKAANLAATMADLDAYKDKIIVFEAIRVSDTTRLASRQPLQPTNTQISSPRLSSHKTIDMKPSYDGALSENATHPPATPRHSLYSTGTIHGQASHANTPSKVRCSPPSSASSRSTSHSEAPIPSSAADQARPCVNIAGFDQYYASLHDRVQASNPDYNDGTRILAFWMLSVFNLSLQDRSTTLSAEVGRVFLNTRKPITRPKLCRPIILRMRLKLSRLPR